MAKDELKKLKKKKDKEKIKEKTKDKVKIKEKDKEKKSKKKKDADIVQEKFRDLNGKYDFVLSMSLEEYLEQIYILSEGNDKVRVTDVAATLGISKPSVNRAINNLVEMGYVEHSNYGGIGLSKKGKEIAKHIYSKHKTLERFLVMVGISEEKAAKEARDASHYLGIETVKRIREINI